MSITPTDPPPPPVNGSLQFTLDLSAILDALTFEQISELAANAIHAIKGSKTHPAHSRLSVAIFGRVTVDQEKDPIPWEGALVLRSVRATFDGLAGSS
jgi:hypothetical protein